MFQLKGFAGVEIADVTNAVVGGGGIELDLGQCLIVKRESVILKYQLIQITH